jgi:hypothetical protein
MTVVKAIRGVEEGRSKARGHPVCPPSSYSQSETNGLRKQVLSCELNARFSMRRKEGESSREEQEKCLRPFVGPRGILIFTCSNSVFPFVPFFSAGLHSFPPTTSAYLPGPFLLYAIIFFFTIQPISDDFVLKARLCYLLLRKPKTLLLYCFS